MKGLEELRKELAEYLNRQSVRAMTAWESDRRAKRDETVAVVSIKACEGGPAGFQDYLGERLDEKSGKWEEWYGRKAEITFGVDIWAPRSGGEEACTTHFSKVAQALTLGGPEGVRFREISCGETVFEEQDGMFRCPVRAVGTVFLLARADESGTFTDFTVKGTKK